MSFTKINHYEKEYADTHHECALTVTEGVENQPVVNPYFVRKKKRALTTEEYVEGILQGNITTLSQAITLVESSNPDHYAQAQEIIEKCLPHAGKSVRIGITGVPGAGKSTFIEAVGNMVTSLKHKLAVLAIDPSSERSGGSILGDKTRMESISSNPKVFIRPSPSAGSLGGVARKTRETIILCEAAGFDVIFIETVGVGPVSYTHLDVYKRQAGYCTRESTHFQYFSNPLFLNDGAFFKRATWPSAMTSPSAGGVEVVVPGASAGV